jgi:GntR family transcriptional regulator, galactonate operon transcriptional repressor
MAMPRPKNFHDQTVDTLGRRMVAGELAPGERMPPEAELAESLGVSRLALREAMKTLAAKGMVSIRTRTGTHVQPRRAWNLFDPTVLQWHAHGGLDAKFVADLMELRRLIEPAAARLAAVQATRPQLQAVRRAYEAMAQAADEAAYIAADLAFHGAVLDACDNAFIGQLQGAIAEVLKVSFTASASPRADDREKALRLHQALLQALEARDADAAAAAVERLIDRATERIRAPRPRRAGAAGAQSVRRAPAPTRAR